MDDATFDKLKRQWPEDKAVRSRLERLDVQQLGFLLNNSRYRKCANCAMSTECKSRAYMLSGGLGLDPCDVHLFSPASLWMQSELMSMITYKEILGKGNDKNPPL